MIRFRGRKNSNNVMTIERARALRLPHIGVKEQERARRCYMSPTFNYAGEIRSAPVMHQLSKRDFD